MSERLILIGVHVTMHTEGLTETLRSIAENTPQPHGLRILPSDAQAAQALRTTHPKLVAAPVPELPGAAACFNQWVCEPADLYVFLESGACVSPDWLDLLLAALDSDPSYGLAGPSTNRAWNEQASLIHDHPHAPQARWAQAHALALRHGSTCTPLAPLHSLADFCYVVKNEVVAAIGAADTAYGMGPCWEMDYNIRAARAGFQGVWVQGSLVYRPPPSSAVTSMQQVLLASNKRLYQDRFCTLRRTSVEPQPAYHEHCTGDECRHFALPEQMRIHLPLPAPPQAPSPQPASELPLMSCTMPTRGRPQFVAQSIRYFLRQDYPRRELIIVYENDADLPEQMDDARIRCIRVPAHTSIGAKRNIAVQAAQGDLIAHWDDDDWYGSERLRRQAEPIVRGLADVTGLTDMLFFTRPTGVFWQCSRPLFGQMFAEGVSGGTLVFRRDLWQRHGPYPHTSLREDADFLQQALRGGAQLCRVAGQALCIYVRHHGNTWRFKEGHYLQPTAWHQVPAPDCVQPDLGFYQQPQTSHGNPALPAPTPLVSCIMPTADRRAFVPQAIRNFLAQDYPHCELIVVDDGTDPVADLIPPHDRIRYVRIQGKASIGSKRNKACALARGELIAHWDDDDWMAPTWLSSQVRTLQSQGADICGLNQVFFYAPHARRAWQYRYDGPDPWVCGGTLCYRRDYWRSAPFADMQVGEDNAFVWSRQPKRIATNPDQHLYVAHVHPGNTSPKDTANRRWHAVAAEQVERLMGS